MFLFLLRGFIPKRDQPLFDIHVGINGEIMQSKKHVDDKFFPHLSGSSDLEFGEYNSRNTAAIGRFG